MPIERRRVSSTGVNVPHGPLASRKPPLDAGTTVAVGDFKVLQRRVGSLPSTTRTSSSLPSDRRVK